MSKNNVLAILLALSLVAGENAAADEVPIPTFLWDTDAKDVKADSYVAFRTTLNVDKQGEVEFRLLGASWYVGWLDGRFFAEGPARFPRTHPEYQTYREHLEPGKHVLAIQVHHIGVPTRMLENQPPFLYAKVFIEGREIPLHWKVLPLDGYISQLRRINPQLGWSEWCDTRLTPLWRSPDFDDSSWNRPVAVNRDLGPLESLSTSNPRSIQHPLSPAASGRLVERFGYETDNPAARFFLRDLDVSEKDSPQGVWRRYDLGRVRLGRPRFVLDLPPGAVVEFGYAEYLSGGRVSPWITLSAGDSCNFDHYIARGGRQEFFPLTPKGGRFMEAHVLAPPEKVAFLSEEYVERCYFGEPDGAFQCDDSLLNRIWSVGVETYRACAEDAMVDNPTRERGQWAGDSVSVGMDVATAAFCDLRLCRRCLIQCAQCARQDGLVAGMCPGQDVFLSTFAAQWVSACVHYWELTGDIEFLKSLWPAAERNLDAFDKQCTPEGLNDSLGWGFVDWGYVRNPGPSDMGINLHYLASLRDMIRWCEALGKTDSAKRYQQRAEQMRDLLARYFHQELAQGDNAWNRIGYHRAVLGLRLGFFQNNTESDCVAFIKSHMQACFPNNPDGPRLSDPGTANSQLITPYFAHYAMPVLIERGEMDFVLDQYRKCWGWALQDGRTTWLEVFDTRWSHCHEWAACPTWQLSRYVLGLHPRHDLGKNHFAFRHLPGSLQKASGRVPLDDTDKTITVQWERKVDGVHYDLTCPEPIVLHIASETTGANPRVIPIEGTFSEIFP